MMKSLLISVAMLFMGSGFTQNKIELEKFIVFSTSSSIELRWTISAGFTCNGTEILKSEDGINFYKIGEINGVCGNLSTSVPYSFSDDKPSSNKQNYYKLSLGAVGESQVVSEFFVELSSEDYLVVPNPTLDEATIHFKNDLSSYVIITLYDASGNQLFISEEIYDSSYTLDLSQQKKGMYFFVIHSSKGTFISGKILKL